MVLAGFLLAAGVGSACFAQGGAAGRSTTDQSTQEIYTQITGLIASGKFAEALPVLAELINRLKNFDTLPAKQTIEWATFQIPVCHANLNEAKEAIEGFERYLSEYPEGQFRGQAQLVLAEIHAGEGDWDKTVPRAEAALKEGKLSPPQTIAAYQLWGHALFRLENWEAALAPLRQVYLKATDRTTRNGAIAMTATCLVRLERLSDLFAFLPMVFRTSARFDVGLNLALMEAGDQFLDNDRPGHALLMYRIVFTKAELVKQVTALLTAATDRLEKLPRSGLSIPELLAETRRMERVIVDYREQLAQLQELPDYDQELTIRLAQTYLNLKRYWEALLLFRSIYDDDPAQSLAQRGLYSAFATAVEMDQPERALVEGYEYVKAYPGGEFWEPLTVMLAELHLQRKEHHAAIAIATKGLEVKPDHTFADHLMYLRGYAHFQEEEFAEALADFGRVDTDYPKSGFREAAAYWHAMCQMYLARYTPARTEFQAHVKQYPDGAYTEDASYRVGVAQYGEADMQGAHDTLRRFVERYPQSQLRSEALSMLGDIVGSWRQLNEALAYYLEAAPLGVNQQQINYATFQAARVYELLSRWDEIITLFRAYLTTYGGRANYTEATYWIALAQMKSDRTAEALQTFFDAVVRWGDEPQSHGVDMMLRDLIAESERLAGFEEYQRFRERLSRELDRAQRERRVTLELRLIALFAETEKNPSRRADLIGTILRESLLTRAGPITLELMGREAVARGQLDLARKVYAQFLTEHAASDLALGAYQGMAEIYITEQRYEEALKLLREITGRFAALPEAGWALKRTGDVFRLQQRYDEAIQAYKDLLTVKEWRGPLWPETVYWLGVSYRERGDCREAAAYFERLYVLYASYIDWVARAYLQRAECLEQLQENAKAIEVLREMVNNPALAQTAEFARAKEQLARLGGSSS